MPRPTLKQAQTVEQAKRALGSIVALIESGESVPNLIALKTAGSVMWNAERWIRVPTESQRAIIRAECRAILENVADSSNRADSALRTFAEAIRLYANCYYAKAMRECRMVHLIAD